jgi:hypothetical protein
MRTSRSVGRPGIFSNVIQSGVRMPRQMLIGIILLLALFAFELFNFDTTRFALDSLLGDIRIAGLAWATILAVAFCAIDFAGLSRLFTPERGLNEPREVWYLTGAWLLGATMNAIMTWWAVSTVLLQHELGNEVLNREQLLEIVPVFVAVLVWLTRILFIGSVTIAGERILHGRTASQPGKSELENQTASAPQRRPVTAAGGRVQPAPVDLASPPKSAGPQPKRVNRRPPRPRVRNNRQGNYNGVSAAGKSRS